MEFSAACCKDKDFENSTSLFNNGFSETIRFLFFLNNCIWGYKAISF